MGAMPPCAGGVTLATPTSDAPSGSVIKLKPNAVLLLCAVGTTQKKIVWPKFPAIPPFPSNGNVLMLSVKPAFKEGKEGGGHFLLCSSMAPALEGRMRSVRVYATPGLI